MRSSFVGLLLTLGSFTTLVNADPFFGMPGSGGGRRRLQEIDGLSPLPERRFLSHCKTSADCLMDAECEQGRCVGGPIPPMYSEPSASPPASAPTKKNKKKNKKPYVAPPLKTGRRSLVGEDCSYNSGVQCQAEEFCDSADTTCKQCSLPFFTCDYGATCDGSYCQCNDDSECPQGMTCSFMYAPERLSCEPTPPTDVPTSPPTSSPSGGSTGLIPCSGDEDCPDFEGFHCASNGFCYNDVCSEDGDCPPGELCVDGGCSHDDSDHTHAPGNTCPEPTLESSGDCEALPCLINEDGWCVNGECVLTRPCLCVNNHNIEGVTPECEGIPESKVDYPRPAYPTMASCLCSYCGYQDQCGGGAAGDPHIYSMAGKAFDYHGECDLKLMQVPNFDGEQNLDIHVRTTIRYDYSYIEAAAIKIGQDVLEVASWGSFALNGVEDALGPNHRSVPTVGGYPVYHVVVNEKKHTFDIVVAPNHNISVSTFKDWVGVKTIEKDAGKLLFGEVSGLVGNINGELLSRNGTNMKDDLVALGQDWQVLPEEEMLFRVAREPQAPQRCRLPDKTTKLQRRLGSSIAMADAEKACARFEGAAFSFCVHDVMASADLEMAESDFFGGYRTF